MKVLVAQLCLTLWDPIDYSPSGSSDPGILQARILECVAIPFPRGSSWSRDQTRVSYITGAIQEDHLIKSGIEIVGSLCPGEGYFISHLLLLLGCLSISKLKSLHNFQSSSSLKDGEPILFPSSPMRIPRSSTLMLSFVVALCLVTELCLTFWNPLDCSPPGSSVHEDSPGKNTEVGSHALLQRIFPNQGSNGGLLHCRWILYQLSYLGSPKVLWNESCSVMSESLWLHGLYSSWNSPGQNIGMGSQYLLQGIFPTQGLNPGFQHCRQILYRQSHQGSFPYMYIYM